MAAEYRAHREQVKQREAQEQARAAKRPDVMMNLPALLREEYGLTQDEAALAVRNGVFSLFPDDAPIEHRQQLWEAQQARKERQAAEQQSQRAIEQYKYNCELAARSATEDAFPDSTAFYDGDHGRYARALEKKALELAADAQQKGLLVDLSVQAVQRALESDLADRLTKTQAKRSSRSKPAEAAPDATTTSQNVASNLKTSTSAVTPAPRTGKKTVKEADAEVMAMLERSMRPQS